MTDRSALTVQHIRDRQAAKGLRKCGVSLKDANLPPSALALHALEEFVDAMNYLTDKPDEMGAAALVVPLLETCAESLAAFADHPKPLPPDVPTAEAVAAYGPWWQLGDEVVRVRFDRGRCVLSRAGQIWAELVDPAGPWLGPVQLRPVPR
jgi:hypothetical protein